METQQHNFGGAHTQRVLPYPMINDEGIPSLSNIYMFIEIFFEKNSEL